jgi:hypothetical protein
MSPRASARRVAGLRAGSPSVSGVWVRRRAVARSSARTWRRRGGGQAGLVGEPGGHGGGAVEFPPPGAVMGGDSAADAGVEPVTQGENSHHGVAVDGDVQPLDCLPQLLEHTPDRTPVRIPGSSRIPCSTPIFWPTTAPPGAPACDSRARGQGRPQAGAANP